MTLVKFNRKPFDNNFNSFVEDFMNEFPGFPRGGHNHSNWKGSVPVNIKETEKSYVLDVVAPGFEKADFKVNLEQNILTITGEKKTAEVKENEAHKSDKWVRREYGFRAFKRSFTIDEQIDATNIEASYVNGVLTLNLPKKEVVKASATEISVK